MGRYLREIAPEFVRSDVYAQLLRARGRDCGEAAALAEFQAESGAFLFGRRGGQLIPHENPVSTAFAVQALAGEWGGRSETRVKVKVAFASGSAEMNREMIARFAEAAPHLPLVVVSEFQPDAGEWIPYHVRRSPATNRAAIRAALNGRQIAVAAVAFSEGTALAGMRAVAFSLAPFSLRFYGGISAALRLPRGVTRWLRRLVHPAEMEIPIRARLAQMYGVAAAGFGGARAKRRQWAMLFRVSRW